VGKLLKAKRKKKLGNKRMSQQCALRRTGTTGISRSFTRYVRMDKPPCRAAARSSFTDGHGGVRGLICFTAFCAFPRYSPAHRSGFASSPVRRKLYSLRREKTAEHRGHSAASRASRLVGP